MCIEYRYRYRTCTGTVPVPVRWAHLIFLYLFIYSGHTSIRDVCPQHTVYVCVDTIIKLFPNCVFALGMMNMGVIQLSGRIKQEYRCVSSKMEWEDVVKLLVEREGWEDVCVVYIVVTGFIQNGNNVKTVHKNNNTACVRDMQIEHPVNTLGQTVLSSLIGWDKYQTWMVEGVIDV